MSLSLYLHSVYGQLDEDQVDNNWLQIQAQFNSLQSDFGILANKKHNFTATTDPTVNDDQSQGYSQGSRWLNNNGGQWFYLVDPSAGEADWVEEDALVAALRTGAFTEIVSSNTDGTSGRIPTIGWTALADTMPSDFWTPSQKAMLFNFGYVGSNGAYATGIYSNGYRNLSGGWTSLGINGETAGAGVEARADGRVQILCEDPPANQLPAPAARFMADGNHSIFGNLSVSGSLSKGSGSFRIPHPLPEKTETHHLVHSFIEGPRADLVYRGRTTLENGQASVQVDDAAGMTPGTFVLLCRDVQAWAQNEDGWSPVKASVSNGTLSLICQDGSSTDTVSWLVIGERNDQHMHETGWTDENGRVIVEPQIPPSPEEDVSE